VKANEVLVKKTEACKIVQFYGFAWRSQLWFVTIYMFVYLAQRKRNQNDDSRNWVQQDELVKVC